MTNGAPLIVRALDSRQDFVDIEADIFRLKEGIDNWIFFGSGSDVFDLC